MSDQSYLGQAEQYMLFGNGLHSKAGDGLYQLKTEVSSLMNTVRMILAHLREQEKKFAKASAVLDKEIPKEEYYKVHFTGGFTDKDIEEVKAKLRTPQQLPKGRKPRKKSG